MIFFWKPPSVFSQWTWSPFEARGVNYSCAEQYMMAAKARLFEDWETLDKIMASTSPARHQALGREVKGFDQKVWEAKRLYIVGLGNVNKFSQNEAMLQELLATGDEVLVEASPTDTVWGIGLAASDPRAQDPSKWRGQNLLGQVLMGVRSKLGAPTVEAWVVCQPASRASR